MTMLTMTSLAAQSQFGNLIDSSQRQPVTITRRGRPVMVTMSYEDYIQRKKTIPYEVFKLISTNFPLRGKEAGDAMRSMLNSLPNTAAEEGLTEEDVMRMLNEE
jgi:prevent-host-death family protein